MRPPLEHWLRASPTSSSPDASCLEAATNFLCFACTIASCVRVITALGFLGLPTLVWLQWSRGCRSRQFCVVRASYHCTGISRPPNAGVATMEPRLPFSAIFRRACELSLHWDFSASHAGGLASSLLLPVSLAASLLP